MKIITLAALAILFAGCDSKTLTPVASPSPTPTKAPTPAVGRKPVDAATVGSISGVVKIDGSPRIVPIPGIMEDQYCSTKHKDPPVKEEFVIGAGSTLVNVLVHVTVGQDAWEWDVPAGKPVLDQDGCIYKPHGMAMRVGQTLSITSKDDTPHNVRAQSRLNPSWSKGSSVAAPIPWVPESAEVACSFTCQVHPWMSAFVHVLDHPLYAVTAADGKFTLNGVPPGEYEVTAWHEKLGMLKVTVTIGAKESKAQDFTFVYKK